MKTFTHDGNGGDPAKFPIGKWIGNINGSKWSVNSIMYDLIYLDSLDHNNGNWTRFVMTKGMQVTLVHDKEYGSEKIKLSSNSDAYPKSGEDEEGIWTYYGVETI